MDTAISAWVVTFRDHDMSGKVVYDTGANNGVVAYMVRMLGCKSAHALDHNEECIQNMKQANNHLGISNVLPVKYSFELPCPQKDRSADSLRRRKDCAAQDVQWALPIEIRRYFDVCSYISTAIY